MIKLADEQEKEIIEYYTWPHLVSDTAKRFDISEYCATKILNKHNIQKHSAIITNILTTNNQLRGKNNNNNEFSSLFLLDDDIKNDIIKTYKSSKSLAFTLNKYNFLKNINKCQLKYFLLKNNITVEKEYYHKVFTSEQENSIIAFYLVPNTAAATIQHFKYLKLNKRSLNLILTKHNITKHAANIINELMQANSLNTYGTAYPQQSELIKAKTRKTCIKLYGCSSYAKTDEFKNHLSNIISSRTPEQKQAINEKCKQTCNAKYGVDNVFQADLFKEKSKQTCLDKYGVEYAIQASDIKEKSRKTREDRYENNWYNSSKNRQTCTEKYGVDWFSKTEDFSLKIRKKYYYNNIGFDSWPELAVYLYCINNNIEIKRATIKFNYTFNNVVHCYFPDFEIEGKLVEIKGDHFFKEDNTMQNPFDHSKDALCEAKYRCMIENNVEIWRSKDYQFALDWFKNNNYNLKDFIRKD